MNHKWKYEKNHISLCEINSTSNCENIEYSDCYISFSLVFKHVYFKYVIYNMTSELIDIQNKWQVSSVKITSVKISLLFICEDVTFIQR